MISDNFKNDVNVNDADGETDGFLAAINGNDSNFSTAVGMVVTKAEGGEARVDMDVQVSHLNPINSLHGGVMFTLADMASGCAVYSLGRLRSASLDANIHYLRPGMNKTHVYAEAKVIKKGRKIVVTEVSIKDQDDLELAMGVFTNSILDKAKGESHGWTKL